MDSIIPTDEEIFLIIEEVSKPVVEKHVSFSSDGDTFFPLTSSGGDNKKERWYQKEEIGQFKLYVQEFTAATIRGENPKTDKEGSSRGLEHYCDLNRMRRKHLTLSHILKVQGTVKGCELGNIVSTCTAWHKEVAFVQGLHDYCDVYNPSMASSVPKMPKSPPEFPYGSESTKKKRCAPTPLATSSKRLRSTRLTAE